ncbi:MAG TPA: hypothetical protein ENK70_05795, partial [Methylophaga sp.]|nr:hypothetical protein [Methylophaga sp.]
MSSIQASLRRSILPTKDRGDVVPDSKKKKAAVPQLLMVPGIVRPVWKFEDGDGLTDAFGNKYDGYNDAGGDSLSVTHTPAESVDEEVDAADENEDIMVYNFARKKYEPKQPSEIELQKIAPTSETGDIPVWNDSAEKYEPSTLVEAGIAKAIITDYLAALIAIPENKVYKLTFQLPFDIVITASDSNFGTGTGTI